MKNFKNNYWVKKFFNSFQGFYFTVKEEKSFIVHLIGFILTIIIAISLKLGTVNWCLIIFASCFPLVIELINTAIENIVDMLSFKYNLNAKKIKDISAAATLISSLVALIVILIIFITRLEGIIKNGY